MGSIIAPEPSSLPAVATPAWTAWRRIAAAALSVAVLADVVLMALHGEVVPPLVAFGVLGAVGVVLLPRTRRTGPWLVIVAALVPLVVGLPLVLPGLAHPESSLDFLHGVATIVFRVLAVGAGTAVVRGATERAARPVAGLAGGAAAVAVAVTIVVAATMGSDVAQPGDVTLSATDSVWTASDITVDRGATVAVENEDPYRHTFTVEGTDIGVELPARTVRRVAIDLPAGTYVLRCDVPGHENMVGELRVQ